MKQFLLKKDGELTLSLGTANVLEDLPQELQDLVTSKVGEGYSLEVVEFTKLEEPLNSEKDEAKSRILNKMENPSSLKLEDIQEFIADLKTADIIR